MADATVAASKKPRTIAREFSAGDGAWHPRVMAEVTAIRFTTKSGHEVLAELGSFPEHIIRMAAAFGLNTTIGNNAGGLDDEAEILEALEGRLADLQAGNWAAERQGGPRGSDIVEAVARVYRDAGAEYPESARQELSRKLYAEEIKPAAVLNSDPRIRAAFEAIKAERHAARMAKLNAAASAAKGNSLPTF